MTEIEAKSGNDCSHANRPRAAHRLRAANEPVVQLKRDFSLTADSPTFHLDDGKYSIEWKNGQGLGFAWLRRLFDGDKFQNHALLEYREGKHKSLELKKGRYLFVFHGGLTALDVTIAPIV